MIDKFKQNKGFIGKIFRSPRTIKSLCVSYWHERAFRKISTQKERELATKSQIKVVFLSVFESTWKVDSIYCQMDSSERFNVSILVCPVVNYGYDNMLKRQQENYEFFKLKGYNVRKAFDENTGTYVDLRKDLSADILFYTNPYKGLIDDRYYIDQYPDILSCYVPYGYNSFNSSETYDLPFHRLLWRFYIESQSLVDFYSAKLKRKRKNFCCVGFPPFDTFNREPKDKSSQYKYIIWAPHHTLDGAFGGKLERKSFLYYYQFMLEMAEKYKDKIFFIFRPHPLLKNKLYERDDWGRDKTDAYYKKWKNMSNCMLSETRDYIDDFALSDAMIHDCGSFTQEYVYTLKPVLFTGERPISSNLVPSANEVVECYQFANSEKEIEDFIIALLDEQADSFIEHKKEFKQKYLTPPNNKTVSQNIVDDIVKSIWGDKLR